MREEIKTVRDISEEIIGKLNQAIIETGNARIFYQKYTSLLDEANSIQEGKYLPL
jgi:hypothetical protein